MNKYFVTNLNPSGPGSLSEGMKWNSDEKRTIYFEVGGKINFPETSYLGFYNKDGNPAAWKNCRNIDVRAESAPSHIIITGSPTWIIDSNNIDINGLTFLLDVPSDEKLANFWGSLRLLSSGPSKSNNINFINCAFLGGEDEAAAYPDPAPKPEVTTPYHNNIKFEGCFFGYGTTKWRGNHNHAIAATLVNGLIFKDNLIVHENRRCPQVDGTSVISGNIVYNYGTMGIGFYRGAHEVYNNLFIRGPQSRDNPLVNLIQIAESDRAGECNIIHGGNKLMTFDKSNYIGFKNTIIDNNIIESIDVRNRNIKLKETKVAGGPLLLAPIFTAGPKVNGKELDQIKRARQEIFNRSGGWVKTLKESGLI